MSRNSNRSEGTENQIVPTDSSPGITGAAADWLRRLTATELGAVFTTYMLITLYVVTSAASGNLVFTNPVIELDNQGRIVLFVFGCAVGWRTLTVGAALSQRSTRASTDEGSRNNVPANIEELSRDLTSKLLVSISSKVREAILETHKNQPNTQTIHIYRQLKKIGVLTEEDFKKIQEYLADPTTRI